MPETIRLPNIAHAILIKFRNEQNKTEFTNNEEVAKILSKLMLKATEFNGELYIKTNP